LIAEKTVAGLIQKSGFSRRGRVGWWPRSTPFRRRLLPYHAIARLGASLASPEDLAKVECYAPQVRLDPNLPQAYLTLRRVCVRDSACFRASVHEVLAAPRVEWTDTQALHSMTTSFISTGDLQRAQCIGRCWSRSTQCWTRRWRAAGHQFDDAGGRAEERKVALQSRDTELAGDTRGMAFLLRAIWSADKEADAAPELVARHYLGRCLKGARVWVVSHNTPRRRHQIAR
jgi:hypothetical protein